MLGVRGGAVNQLDAGRCGLGIPAVFPSGDGLREGRRKAHCPWEGGVLK